ncbi:epithelial cell transforming sequence 2 oncoprotein-like [Massospora cicadina]|nr:epithelial cell transforming sequence 2 oncoprotein-like [Massospora cicadina]
MLSYKAYRKFEGCLRHDFYLYDLLPPAVPRPSSTLSTVNFAPDEFPIEAAIRKIFLGYDEDLGPMCLSIRSRESMYTVRIRSNWRTSEIKVDATTLSPSSLFTCQLISCEAYSVVVYLALEKYLDELEEDWFRLLNWQQKINFTSPYTRDVYEKFESDHSAYVTDLKAAITFSISTPQIAKEGLHRIIRQFELIDDPSISLPLHNLERKMAQRYIYTDIVIDGSDASRTLDLQPPALSMFGQPLVNLGVPVEFEGLAPPKIIAEEITDSLMAQERRKLIVEELIETELRYVKKLQAILKIFVIPLRQLAVESRPIILPYDIKAVFNNIEDIASLNERFLEALVRSEPAKRNLGEICESHLAKFGIYQTYIAGYKYSLEYTSALERKNGGYHNFVRAARDHPDCEKLAIRDLIVMPVQRLPRYKLLFTGGVPTAPRSLEYLRFTPKDHPEYLGFYRALVKVNELSHLSGQRLTENATELSNLLHSIADCPPKLLSSSRYLITHLECTERDIATLVPQETVSLFLLNDCLIITRHTRDQPSGRKRALRFISWMSLVGLEILDPELPDSLGGVLLRGCLDFSEDLYWDHQEMHLFVVSNVSDKESFYTKETGCSCFYKTVEEISVYYFVYTGDNYGSSHYKRWFTGLSLASMANLRKGCHSVITKASKLARAIQSSLLKPGLDPERFGSLHCKPAKFQEVLFHHVVYTAFALRATPAYLQKQHLINRCMLESLFGLHFPSCKLAHPYLTNIKSFSRAVREDRPVLISNGAAISYLRPRRDPRRHHLRHQLGAHQLDLFRDLSHARNLSDPTPIIPDKAKTPTLTPATLKPRTAASSTLPSAPNPKADPKSTPLPRKKGSLSKVTRLFSWTK